MLKSTCGLSCIVERMPRVKCQAVLSCEICPYIWLICPHLPIFFLTGEYILNPKPPVSWVQYPGLVTTDTLRRKKTVARASATLHSLDLSLILSHTLWIRFSWPAGPWTVSSEKVRHQIKRLYFWPTMKRWVDHKVLCLFFVYACIYVLYVSYKKKLFFHTFFGMIVT